MGGGASKNKHAKEVTEERDKNNIDQFLVFLNNLAPNQTSEAAVKVQSSYRRLLAKKQLKKLVELREAQEEAALRYIEIMKDSKKVNARKSILKTSFSSPLASPSKSLGRTIVDSGDDHEGRGSGEAIGRSEGESSVSTKSKVSKKYPRPKFGNSSKFSSRHHHISSEAERFSPSFRGKGAPKRNGSRYLSDGITETDSIDHDEEGFGLREDDEYGEEDDEVQIFEKIYPLLGFVIKTKFLVSEKKVFINVLHNPAVASMICSPFREYIDTSHYDDDGYLQSVSVGICDVIIPSLDFHKLFHFREGTGLVPKAPVSARPAKHLSLAEIDDRAKLAVQILAYLNGLSHCLDEKNPPIAGMTDCDDYTLDESYYSLPKMKKMYYGTPSLFYYNRKEHILNFYQPLSWYYLLKQIPDFSEKYPLPETYFHHYYIDPFGSSTSSSSAGNDGASISIDDFKRRSFPPDIQYPMALSYQCLLGDFDRKNPMKSIGNMLGGSTASSLKMNIVSGVPTTTPTVSRTAKMKLKASKSKAISINDLTIDDDDDDDSSIPPHQKQFLENLAKLKAGYPVFMDLSFGIMSLYLSRSDSALLNSSDAIAQTSANDPTAKKKKKDKTGQQSSLIPSKMLEANQVTKDGVLIPYGEGLIARIALCNFTLSTSYDNTNQIFYLHFEPEFSADHAQYSPFFLSNYINEVSDNIDLKQFTFQFSEYTELMTFQLLIERHIFYCKYCSGYSASLPSTVPGGKKGAKNSANSATPASAVAPYLYSQIKYDNAAVAQQPTSKFLSLVERLSVSPLTRQKKYLKVERGLIGVFADDLKITPTWKNAIEIISLVNKRFEVISHRKIIRLRKFITKLHLIDDKNKRIREFFFKGEGESDQELQGIVNCVQQQIQYANSHFFRYQYHYLESLGLFNRPPHVSQTSSTEGLHVWGFDSQVQIFVPEPHTSDDDSDLEEPPIFDSDSDQESRPAVVASAVMAPAPPPPSILRNPSRRFSLNPRSLSYRNTAANKIVYGSYFRVIKSRFGAGGTGSSGNPSSSGYSSTVPTPSAPPSTPLTPFLDSSLKQNSLRKLSGTNPFSPSKAPEIAPETAINEDSSSQNSSSDGIPSSFDEIIDHWQDNLCRHFSSFSKFFFRCRLYFLEESDLLLVLQDQKLVAVMKISKVLEKPTLSSLHSTSPAAAASSSSQGNNNIHAITANILRRNSTPMRIINRPPLAAGSVSALQSTVSTAVVSLSTATAAEVSLPPLALSFQHSQPALPTSASHPPTSSSKTDLSSALVKQASVSFRLSTGESANPQSLSAKLFDLDSDEEDDDDQNSDRDYLETDPVTELSTYLANKGLSHPNGSQGNPSSSSNNETNSNQSQSPFSALIWIFKVLSYDGRTYRFKFSQKSAYERLSRFFYQHCLKPAVKADLSSLLLKEDETLSAEAVLPEIVFDNEATKKYSRLLRPNEKVIAAGTVLKHEKTVPLTQAQAKDTSAVPKQRRVLLVTDSPRLVFIDTIGNISRGQVELQSDAKNEVKAIDGLDFEALINGNLHRFTCADVPEKDPKYWTIRIRQGLSLSSNSK